MAPFFVAFHFGDDFGNFFVVFLFGVLFVEDAESAVVQGDASEAVTAVVDGVAVLEVI